MSNISFFFPKKVQGYALGMNAGLGNFGVTTMQILVPLAMTMALFGGEAMILQNTSGTLIGKIKAGAETWIHNAGYIWVCILIPLAIASWWGMNNIIDEHVSPNIGSTASAFSKIIVMLGLGLLIAGAGLYLMLPATANGAGVELNKWVALPLIIAITVLALKLLPLGADYKQGLKRQYQIFGNKHTWAMTVIYTMTFGSFIGYSAALALSIKVIFGFQHVMVDGVMTHDTINPNGPSALTFAWMGPFIGALIRPIGGKIADKMGGCVGDTNYLAGDGGKCIRCCLFHESGVCLPHARRIFLSVLNPVPNPVRGDRGRQRLNFSAPSPLSLIKNKNKRGRC